MSRTPSTIAAGIAAFAALAPAAVAMPADGPINSSAIRTSSLSGLTTTQRQDLRSPDSRDAAVGPSLELRRVARPPVFPTAHVALPPVHQSHIVKAGASDGFDVTDAALGAGGAFAAIVIATAGGVALRRRSTARLAA